MDSFFDVEFELSEDIGEDSLVILDGFNIRLIEADPKFDSVAGGIVGFGGDESEAVDLVTTFEIGSNEEKGELLVDFLLIGLRFEHLEDESASFLIHFVFPFGLNALLKELNRVDLFERLTDEVAN